MTDPLGLINSSQGMPGIRRSVAPDAANATSPDAPGGPDFKKMMLDQLKQVNELDREATQAIEDFETGKRTDFETVMLATRKADMATQMLLQLRNKVMTAYDEVKQIRV